MAPTLEPKKIGNESEFAPGASEITPGMWDGLLRRLDELRCVPRGL